MNFNRMFGVILIIILLILPVIAADTSDQVTSAGALYSKSVDLANAGKYAEALEASDEALALNVTSLVPLIQANRAGILVMLGRFEEANTAADATLAITGNLTTSYSIAWYNKGNALRSLGRLDEAKTAYAHAVELDPSLVPPDLMSGPVQTVPISYGNDNFTDFLVLGIIGAIVIFGFFVAIKLKNTPEKTTSRHINKTSKSVKEMHKAKKPGFQSMEKAIGHDDSSINRSKTDKNLVDAISSALELPEQKNSNKRKK